MLRGEDPVRACFALSLSLLVGPGCESSPGPEPAASQVLVARADGGDVFVGIVVSADEVFSYACDGTSAGTTISSWFAGTRDGDTVHLDNPAGSALDVEIGDGSAMGTYTSPDGDALSFSGIGAVPPEGLYFGERGHGAEELWGGWVLIGQDQRGAVVDRTTGDVVVSPSIDPNEDAVDVDGAPLDYESVGEPLGEDLDEIPPG